MRTWIFADFSLPDQQTIGAVRDIGFSDIVFGVSSSQKEFSLLYDREKLTYAMLKAKDNGIATHLMPWALRKPGFTEAVVNVLGPIYEAGEASSILYNAEGTWHRSSLLSPQAAADEVADKKGSMSFGVVGLGQLNATVEPLAKVCDYCIPESYSFWKAGSDDHWSHSQFTFPCSQQRRDFNTWKNTANKIAIGQACYDGARPPSIDFPGFADIQSMRVALAESLAIGRDLGPRYLGNAYWSLKHILGTEPIRVQRQKFLMRLCRLQYDIQFP